MATNIRYISRDKLKQYVTAILNDPQQYNEFIRVDVNRVDLANRIRGNPYLFTDIEDDPRFKTLRDFTSKIPVNARRAALHIRNMQIAHAEARETVPNYSNPALNPRQLQQIADAKKRAKVENWSGGRNLQRTKRAKRTRAKTKKRK